MQFLSYFLAAFVSFLGIAVGIILVKIAPEEQRPLRNYFRWAKKIIMILLFIFLLFFYFFDKFSLILTVLLAIPALFVEFKSGENARKIMEVYSIFGIVLFLSSLNKNLMAIASSSVFLYGMLASGMIFNNESRINSRPKGRSILHSIFGIENSTLKGGVLNPGKFFGGIFNKNALKVILSGTTLLAISNILFLLNYHFSFLI